LGAVIHAVHLPASTGCPQVLARTGIHSAPFQGRCRPRELDSMTTSSTPPSRPRRDPRRRGRRLRVPPQSIEAEQSVLGGLLLDNGAWDRAATPSPRPTSTATSTA
jgi:hypothetical protein